MAWKTTRPVASFLVLLATLDVGFVSAFKLLNSPRGGTPLWDFKGFGEKQPAAQPSKNAPQGPPKSPTPKIKETKGIGTLFSSGDEVIRELSSEEYVDVLRDWAPIAAFAASQAVDTDIKSAAEAIRTTLRGMAEWQPRRNSDFTIVDSMWAFGAPVAALKGGHIDALACLQICEDKGVIIEWVCENPTTLGIQGNAADWLMTGIATLCGNKLNLPVTVSPGARGVARDEDKENKPAES
ncbi:unnamed protein product [Discosporangium mesarthrocarpum]